MNSDDSKLATEIWDLFREYIPVKYRDILAEELVGIFDDYGRNIDKADDLLEDAGMAADDS